MAKLVILFSTLFLSSVNAFRCETEIPNFMVCDHVPQCPDGSDEMNCAGGDSFWCDAGGYDIPNKLLCDGYPNCPDGADEMNCDPCDEPFIFFEDRCLLFDYTYSITATWNEAKDVCSSLNSTLPIWK